MQRLSYLIFLVYMSLFSADFGDFSVKDLIEQIARVIFILESQCITYHIHKKVAFHRALASSYPQTLLQPRLHYCEQLIQNDMARVGSVSKKRIDPGTNIALHGIIKMA